MFSKWCKSILISLLLVMIILPTEEDGVFASVLLPVASQNQRLTIKNKIAEQEKIAEPEISGVDESATFARSRCDFLDLVFDIGYHQNFFRIILFSKHNLGRDDIFQFLLSYFLLNLPPPVV